jgi:glucosamine--fructose-6-phosphate aminotransferase (isomerizing)
MCGIIGYIGDDNATPVLIDGLKRLEYRGYDSAGIAVSCDGEIKIQRAEGKLSNLEQQISGLNLFGRIGIGHTRWATHGRPSEMNAHPQRAGDIIVVHNGIVENYADLKKFLMEEGRQFSSETDTEVICHLVDYFYKRNGGDTFKAMFEAKKMLKGSYAVVIMNAKEADRLYIARLGGPLVIGETKNANFVASDIPALLPYTKEMLFLEDGDLAILYRDKVELYDEEGREIKRTPQHIPWSPLMAEKGGYKHFMLKEIFEQPSVLQDVLAGRTSSTRDAVMLDEIDCLFDGGRPIFDDIMIIACGTSLHAAKVGKYMIESLAKVPVSVDYASEFRYRDPILGKRTLVVPISQSGETADTLAAQKMATDIGCPVMGICNVVGSSVTRAANTTIYIHAGPEIGVASTKAFTAQLVTLYLFALNLADRIGQVGRDELKKHINEFVRLPRLAERTLKGAKAVRNIAENLCEASDCLYIGRGMNYPVALEGALKLKEISYLHAEGFPGGELKHGPIALIDHGVPVIAIIPQDDTYDKILSNLEEVKARGAYTIALASECDKSIGEKVEDVITIPKACKFLTPVLASIPLQLLAYYVADHKGTDVDQPRNLAKSVTVE